jgi:hypothetical protein
MLSRSAAEVEEAEKAAAGAIAAKVRAVAIAVAKVRVKAVEIAAANDRDLKVILVSEGRAQARTSAAASASPTVDLAAHIQEAIGKPTCRYMAIASILASGHIESLQTTIDPATRTIPGTTAIGTIRMAGIPRSVTAADLAVMATMVGTGFELAGSISVLAAWAPISVGMDMVVIP